ncbi:hypothetical protein QL285_057946 [Trifolium repens]|nr:hypothetical protein QL285_057946 [Trifolium repens]
MSKGIKIKDQTNQFKTLLNRGRSPEVPAGPAKHVSRMGQSRGKPLRGRTNISKLAKSQGKEAKRFKCPTDWGKTGCTGAGSPYTSKLLKQSQTDIYNHWVRNLCRGLTSSHHPTKSHDIISNHSPPTIGALIIVMH